MQILIAPDSFKGSLNASEAAEAIAAGISAVSPDAELVLMPLADGGEGSIDAVRRACGGRKKNHLLLYGSGCALIESAALIGPGLPSMQQDVLSRGSFVLGEVVRQALDEGVTEIRVALGGSATVDGGLGLLMALGCRILDRHGHPVSRDLKGLMQAERIEIEKLDKRLSRIQFIGLSDVLSPLCGNQGAVKLYGPQKGLVQHQLDQIEQAMLHWGELCEKTFGVLAMGDQGAGAAGGIGFALRLLGGALTSGAAYIMDVCDFDQVAQTADRVITGEGRSDAQTRSGKLPWRVSARAKQFGASVVLISGDIPDEADLSPHFDQLISACPRSDSLEDAMRNAAVNLKQAAARWAASL